MGRLPAQSACCHYATPSRKTTAALRGRASHASRVNLHSSGRHRRPSEEAVASDGICGTPPRSSAHTVGGSGVHDIRNEYSLFQVLVGCTQRVHPVPGTCWRYATSTACSRYLVDIRNEYRLSQVLGEGTQGVHPVPGTCWRYATSTTCPRYMLEVHNEYILSQVLVGGMQRVHPIPGTWWRNAASAPCPR